MIVLLSPAKSLDFHEQVDFPTSSWRLQDQTAALAKIMKTKKSEDLQKLMSISKSLGDLNYDRFQRFEMDHGKANAKASLFAFQGDVYKGLRADTFTQEQVEFAQQHVRILSGFYGLLRPLDLIQPYRLEMGTKLKNEKGNNLYEFWGDQIAKLINEDAANSNSTAILNLASNEYWKAVDQSILSYPVYDVQFREYRGNDLKFISFNAKKARGFMTNYIVKNQVTDVEDLKGFDQQGYEFEPDMSTEKSLFFVREEF